MTLASRSLCLPGGMQLHLIRQPDASKAAALVQIAAGSHHEPDRWPGLAHLLEHLLFSGSAAFPDEQRLMTWIQGAGGRVNATTLQQSTAFFFEVAAPQLDDALARLMDMMAAPRFTAAAVAQEVAVIDAEYQLLQHHTPTLSEAALLASVAQPAAFQRFQVGSRSYYGTDMEALRSALRAFHQRHYQRANMQLWLQGPEPLDQLEQMARSACAWLPAGEPASLPVPPQLHPTRDTLLCVEGPPSFWLSYLLPALPCTGDTVTLLREFATDDAPGSLLATLRARGLCDSLNFQWLYLSANTRWLALQFQGEQLTPGRAQEAEAVWWAWLQALERSTPAQRSHYARLASDRFLRLSPLDQLRERAFGFAAAAADGLSTLIPTLSSASVTRLFCGPEVQGEPGLTQGFTLQRQAWQTRPIAPPCGCVFYFYPLQETVAKPPLPAASGPLLHSRVDSWPASLLLRPAFFRNFSLAEGKARAARLRPYFASLRHLGGEGEFSVTDGVWQLRLRLPEIHSLWAVKAALSELAKTVPCGPSADEEAIAIRALLARLPEQLAPASVPTGWCAALSGGDKPLHHRLSRLLSPLTAAVSQTAPPAVASRSLRRIAHRSQEQALLLFIPLPRQDEATLAAGRALALLYEPRFFQRLRVDQQVGYVVSCRYMRCADRDGILFLLQSPDRPPAQLLRHCKSFLRDFCGEMAELNAEVLGQLQSRLRLLMTQQDATELARCALCQQAGLPVLTEPAVQALRPADLQVLHYQLLRARRSWTLLFCGGRLAPATAR